MSVKRVVISIVYVGTTWWGSGHSFPGEIGNIYKSPMYNLAWAIVKSIVDNTR